MILTAVSTHVVMIVLFLLLSYVIGSIPFGLVLGKLIAGIDIREHGSKNIGTTNTIRVLGKKIGFLVFFCDVFKGILVIMILKILDACGIYTLPKYCQYIYFGCAAIIGHSFSCFLKFKGGKSVATSLGVMLVISPLPALLCLIAFLVTLYSTGYVSLSSTFATLTVLIVSWILFIFGIDPSFGIDSNNIFMYFIQETDLPTCILISTMSVLIIVKHRKNYVRLIQGTENNFKKAKKEKKAALAAQQNEETKAEN